MGKILGKASAHSILCNINKTTTTEDGACRNNYAPVFRWAVQKSVEI